MSERKGQGDWADERARRVGPPDREIRFRTAAKAIASSIRRNRSGEGNPDCPILVEGLRDEKALRELGLGQDWGEATDSTEGSIDGNGHSSR